MIGSGYNLPKISSILLGIVVFVIVLMLLCSLSDAVKLAGSPFLFLPSALGLIRTVTADQVHSIDLASASTIINLPAAGRYAIYCDDYDLLTVADQIHQVKGSPWIRILPQDGGEELLVSYVERGLSPYDTPLVKGRPIYNFEISSPGQYQLIHPVRPVRIAIVPDYTSGNERVIFIAYAIQIALIALLVGLILYQRNAGSRRRIAELEREVRTRQAAYQKRRKEGKSRFKY